MKRCSISQLADHALLQLLATLLAPVRVKISELLVCLAEVDERKLYLGAAYPSMYQYCIKHLHMSEDTAFKRIRAARTAREFPEILPALADGRLHVSAVVMLAPYLTPGNARDLLAAAVHRTKAEIELLLAERFPKPELATNLTAIPLAPVTLDLTCVPAGLITNGEKPVQLVANMVCQLAPGPVGMTTPRHLVMATDSQATRAKIFPLSPQRFGMTFTMEQEMHDDLRYAQALLGHAEPSGIR